MVMCVFKEPESMPTNNVFRCSLKYAVSGDISVEGGKLWGKLQSVKYVPSIKTITLYDTFSV